MLLFQTSIFSFNCTLHDLHSLFDMACILFTASQSINSYY